MASADGAVRYDVSPCLHAEDSKGQDFHAYDQEMQQSPNPWRRREMS